MNQRILPLLVGFLLTLGPAQAQVSSPTTIAYQARLTLGGVPGAGVFDLRFRLYDAATGGNLLGEVTSQTAVTDPTGAFTAEVDFGPSFNAEPRWVELAARRAGSPTDFQTLLPRQQVRPVPTALHALQAGVAAAVGPTGLVAIASSFFDKPNTFTAPPTFNPVSGLPFRVGSGSTQKVDNLNAALLDGHDATQFWRRSVSGVTEIMGPIQIGHALELRLGAERALRLQPPPQRPSSLVSPSLIGGGRHNVVGPEVSGGVIAGGDNNQVLADLVVVGGGHYNFVSTGSVAAVIGGGERNNIDPSGYCIIGGGYWNRISDSDWATIGGGTGNNVGPHADNATIGGGSANQVRNNAISSTIAGGNNNKIFASYATIAGGGSSEILPGSDGSFIGGGGPNKIVGRQNSYIGGGGGNEIGGSGPVDSGHWTVIGGGWGNKALAGESGIFGGTGNRIDPNGRWSFIGGGHQNIVKSNAQYAMIPGGTGNEARASYTFAGGYHAKAMHEGAFVWSGFTSNPFHSSYRNEFAVCAYGGVRLVTDGAGLWLDGQRVLPGGGAIPDGAIISSKLATSAVTSVNLATDAVTEEKIADGAVTAEKLGMGSVGPEALQVAAVGPEHIMAQAVMPGNLATETVMALNAAAATSLRFGTSPGLEYTPATEQNPEAAFGLKLLAGEGIALAPNAQGLAIAVARSCTDYTNCYWNLRGNGNIGAGVNFLGTTAGELDPLEFRVNNVHALRILPAGPTPNIVGGFSGNSILAGVVGANIGGGGEPGAVNHIGENYGSVGGGSGQTINRAAYSATISGGNKNTIATESAYATIAGGDNNTILAKAPSSSVGGGQRNVIEQGADLGTVPGGQAARVSNHGQLAYASGAWASAGEAQFSLYVLRRTLTTAAATELFLDGDAATQRMKIPAQGTWTFDILVAARTGTGNSAGYRLSGVVRNHLGATALVGAPAKTVLAEDLAAWDVWVEADDANDALVIKAVTPGTALTPTRWVATVRTTEVIF